MESQGDAHVRWGGKIRGASETTQRAPRSTRSTRLIDSHIANSCTNVNTYNMARMQGRQARKCNIYICA